MKALSKRLYPILLAVALAGSAFQGGLYLRRLGEGAVSAAKAPPQASALLKLNPERAPVRLETLKTLQGPDEECKSLFSSVLRLVKEHYVEKITEADESKMARGAVQGMLDALQDPDTRLIEPEDRKFLENAEAGKFNGMGAVLALRKEKIGSLDTIKVVVVAPLPGSPASEAGIKAGDCITHVDGKWIIAYDPFSEPEVEKARKALRNGQIDVASYNKVIEEAEKRLKNGLLIPDALEKLTANTSGTIDLTLERPQSKTPIQVKVHCRTTAVDPVMSRNLNGGLAYIRVSQFTKRAQTEFANEMDKVEAERAKGIVLDLRDNAGGAIDAVTSVASRFTGGGVLATIQEKNRRHNIRVPKTRAISIPVVVLVNGGTSSVAELLAGTLRDCLHAPLVGLRTFGDGLVQTPVILKDGSVVLITTGKMLTPQGTDFEGKGLEPDVVVENKGPVDAQLAAAEKILRSALAGRKT